MSGGAYDYLYEREYDDLDRMTARLKHLAPNSAAARDTAEIMRLLSNDALREVWRTVEWLDSGDYGSDQVEEEIVRYEGREPKGGAADD